MILLLEWTIKTCLILALAFGVSWLVRRRSAARRHLVWVAAFSAIAILPLCSLLIPSSLHSKLPAPIRILTTPQLQSPVPIGSADVFAEPPASARPPILPLSWLALIWLVGCLASAVILVDGSVRLAWTSHVSTRFLDARWARVSSELSRLFRLKRPVRLIQSSDASMPTTWGLLRPRVLLPAGAEYWSDKHIRFVLSHEFAHIRRCDWPIQLLAEILRVVYWFNPLIWVACNRLRQEGEHACDDAVLLMGADGTEYADNLLEVARTLKAKRGWSLALAMARPSKLEKRFAAMINPSLDRRVVTRGAVLTTALAVLCVVLPLASLRAQIVQAGVSFSGNVYDANGTAISNATIILTRVNDATQRVTTTSSRTGTFEFSKLVAGHYRVDISRAGFASLHIDDIDIEDAGDSPLNAMLPAQDRIAAPVPARPSRGQRASGPATIPDQRYRIGDIQVRGAKAVNETQIVQALGLVPGEVYDEDRLRRGFENLKTVYGSRGYVNFVPMPEVDFDEQQKVVSLTINIDEDRQFTVNRINFTGNTMTRDEVLRREIMVKEGQVFNSSLWDLSLSRLNQLGYVEEIQYEDVEIRPSSTEPTLDINVKVREKGRN